MKKFKVTYSYHGVVTVDVEAESPEKAEAKGLVEAEEAILGALTLVSATVREIKNETEN